ncbi:LysR family transcriptional regulator ArgP [Uliginosibacterium gangwonense]|uniref:LysR family transcriptional regulator ArgP n=1 Tax=Uliginosibacterium gangwonense TaxID=392736 RepID=UPI000362B60C|nr:LysR family transcriptional regulator ArgP [Uliginosibacterium gangwonense]
MNIDFSLLECLEAVVTEGSFDKAAQALAITQSAVSQRIRALESQVGLPLLFRTRPVRPTPAAQPLLRFARQTRLLAMEVWPEVAGSLTQGHLRIAVNADSLGTWVLPALKDWMDRYEVMLEFVVDDQTQTQVRLRNGEVVGSITSDPEAAKGFVAVALGEMPYKCVASPAFARRYFPNGLDVGAARVAPVLVFNRRDALQTDHLRRCLGWSEPRFPHHFVPAFEAYLQAAVLGYGYGMSPLAQCQSLLDEGILVDITPRVPASVPLYWHTWLLESELIGSLGKALLAGAKQSLSPLTTTGQ